MSTSTFDYRSLPPLPDSPVTAPRLLPSSPTRTTYSGTLSYISSRQEEQRHHDAEPESDVYPHRRPQRSDHSQQARVPSSDNYRSTPFLLRSPSKYQQQVPKSLPAPISPAKIPLPPSPTRPSARLAAQALSSSLGPAYNAADESCILPQHLGAGLGLGTGGPHHGSGNGGGQNLSFSMIGDTSMPEMISMEFDESLEFGSRATRSGVTSAIKARTIVGPESSTGISAMVHQSPFKAVRAEKVGATPTRTVEPKLPSSRSSPVKPLPNASSPSRSSRSPIKAPSVAPTPRTKRTFPASSSNNMLSRLGEERSPEAGDISSILPMSPMGMGHLMDDEHQLLRQSLPMSEGPSLYMPPPPAPASSRKTPRARGSPVKDADMTFDVNQLMARMAKPKRPSGTEESFVDLLHDSDLDLDDMDGDETFLPADLRPRTKSLSSRPLPSSANTKAMDMQSPARRSAIDSASPRIETKQRVRGEHAAQASPRRLETIPRRHMTPGRPTTDRAAPTLQASRAVPTPRRMAQPPVSSRRISLSAGSVPLPSSASYSRMELPKPTTAAPPARQERPRSIVIPDRAPAGAVQNGLANPRSERVQTARSATSVTQRTMSSIAAPSTRHAVPVSTTSREQTSRPGSTRTGISTLGAMGPPSRSVLPSARSSTQPGSTTISSTRPASFRPTSMIGTTKSSLPPATGRTAAQPASTLTRPTATSRTFGADGAGQTNRLPTRPGTLGSKALTAVPGKMSMAPIASPSKRTTASSLKSRAASTPAEVVARTLTRPSVRPAPSMLPPSSRGATSGSGSGSALTRPATSRLPTTSAGGKLSSGPSRTSANLAALRARIDAVSAQQAASRKQ